MKNDAQYLQCEFVNSYFGWVKGARSNCINRLIVEQYYEVLSIGAVCCDHFKRVQRFGGDSFGPITQSRGDGGHTTEVVDDDTRSVSYTFTNGGKTGFDSEVIGRRFDRPAEGFQTFGGNEDGIMMFEAIGDMGGVRVTGHVDHTRGNIHFGTEVEGLSSGGTTPTKGTAEYGGKYVGFLQRGPNTSFPGLTQSYITGDVNVTADFARNQVSGDINNRTRFLTRTGANAGGMADVQLTAHTIGNGQSVGAGALSGGGIGGTSYRPNGGQLGGEWSVAFGGDDAAEVGGMVTIDHDYQNGFSQTPDDYIETGGFVAVKQ